MITNRNIARKYQSLFIQAKDFNSVGHYDGDATGNPVGIQDVNQPAVVLSEIGTTGFLGLEMGTDGYTVQHVMPLPRGIDYDQPIYARILWSSQSADTADDVLWKVFYELAAADAALTGTINDALDVVLVADNVIAADRLQFTAAGKINASKIDPDTKAFIMLQVEMDTKAVGLAEAIHFVGLELSYVPAFCTDEGAGVAVGAPW